MPPLTQASIFPSHPRAISLVSPVGPHLSGPSSPSPLSAFSLLLVFGTLCRFQVRVLFDDPIY